MKFIDAHAHLDRYSDELLPRVLEELAELQLLTIGVAMNPASYARTCALAAQSPWVLPTFGIHPWEATEYADKLDTLWPMIDQSPMIGEIGLDFYWVENREAYPVQRRVFEFLLEAARSQQKIVNMHTKEAEGEVVETLERFKIERAIVHWYSGPLETAKQLVARGALFTFGVEIHSSELIQELARTIPLELLLTETDNPGGLEWLRGEVGRPTHLPSVVKTLARLRSMDAAELGEVIRANFLRLIDGDPHLADLRARML